MHATLRKVILEDLEKQDIRVIENNEVLTIPTETFSKLRMESISMSILLLIREAKICGFKKIIIQKRCWELIPDWMIPFFGFYDWEIQNKEAACMLKGDALTENYPCEFARDCFTKDGETCGKDPETCEKWKRLVALEESE